MSIIYKKTLKGVEEVALRTNGLRQPLRAYLILVDGVKTTDEIQHLNPNLPEVDMVFGALLEEAYLEVVVPPISSLSNLPQVEKPQATPVNSSAPEQAMAADKQSDNSQFLQARDSMQREIMVLLGKDAEMVISKIQRCDNCMDLFAMMMGLKKIITMYANSEKAEKFVTKFSYIATL